MKPKYVFCICSWLSFFNTGWNSCWWKRCIRLFYTVTIMEADVQVMEGLNSLRPRQDGRHFADDIFKCIFLNENEWILINISLKFVPKDQIKNTPALVQIMAWHRPEPMMVSLLTHMCITRPLWVNSLAPGRSGINFKSIIFKLIISGKGLVPSGNKPLPEPKLTQIYVIISRQ